MKLTCPHCQSTVTTKTKEETSALAWIVCGACCLFGFWPCACIPFCIDSMQAVSGPWFIMLSGQSVAQ